MATLQEEGDEWAKRIIFSDEKWFYLIQSSNRKNNVYWSMENPHILDEVKRQGGVKVMCWAGVGDGKILPLHWFEGSVTENTYLNMLKEKVWPALKGFATKKCLWFQQDGARVHTANSCLKFLQEKFPGREISNRLDYEWPPYSADVSMLDFWFWGQAQQEVYKAKPKSIEELKNVVERFAKGQKMETILRAANNFVKRAKLCVEQEGGHFEHLLK